MSDQRSRLRSRLPYALGLLAVGAAAGGIVATTVGASANPSPSTATQTASTQPSQPGRGWGNLRGANPVRSDEKSLDAATAATLKAAALKAVPGGTVYRVETDAGDAAYEAHMTKADGSLVTVKFDKNLKVLRVESGMGKGDPGPPGQPH